MIDWFALRSLIYQPFDLFCKSKSSKKNIFLFELSNELSDMKIKITLCLSSVS